MAQEAPLAINVKATFTGKKAFKEADTATAKLSKSAIKLGKSLGVAFSVRAVVQYTKAAAMAAAQDQQAQAILSNNLKNLGLAYASVDSEKFIASLEKQTSILDDELRPAYSQLARVTGNIAATQKLMRVAFDASKGAGLSYASTVDILSQAYVGNNKGLKQLNLGLTTAELAAMDFDEILTVITAHFNGAGAQALKGYAGQMAALNVASKNSAETIGGALLDGFAKLAGGGSIDKATSKIDTFSKTVAGLIRLMTGVTSLSVAFDAFGEATSGSLFYPAPKKKPLVAGQSPADRAAIDKANAKAKKDATALAALAKSQAASELAKVKAKKDQLALDKAAIALGKGKDVFDLEAIQINAAMISTTQQLGKVTTQTQLLALTNDLARLRVKEDMLALEAAIASGDAAAATAAARKLNTDLAILGTLSNQALKLADIKGILAQIAPKSLIDISNLDDAIRKIKEMLALQGTKVLTAGTATSTAVSTGTTSTVTSTSDYVTPIDKATAALASIDAIIEYADAATARANAFADLLDMQTAAANAKYATNQAAQAAITLNFNSPIYTVSDQEFSANVQRAIQNANRFGNNLDYAGAI
jgi:hypothetical protein